MVLMCGRFAMNKSTNDLVVEFVAEGGDFRDWQPGWNIRPTDPVAAVIETEKDGTLTRRLERARWSLTPGWSKTLKMKVPTFNARSEGITEKPAFKSAIQTKRALIPASGYYEWQTDPVTNKKTPFFIRPAEGETMAFAGIYSWWRDHSLAEDDPLRWTLTTTILTADAVHTLDHIHDRNPVPLPRDWWDDWLSPAIEGTQDFVDAAVAAAVPVAESLEILQIVAATDDEPVEA
jgi:putative SOS response-associated peptidase YedK